MTQNDVNLLLQILSNPCVSFCAVTLTIAIAIRILMEW